MNWDGEQERRITPCRKHEEILSGLDKKVDFIVERQSTVIEEVKKTNGRVTTLENQMNDVRVWRGFLLGGLAVITALVIPMFLAWFSANLK